MRMTRKSFPTVLDILYHQSKQSGFYQCYYKSKHPYRSNRQAADSKKQFLLEEVNEMFDKLEAYEEALASIALGSGPPENIASFTLEKHNPKYLEEYDPL